jgi:hypothetical protein
LGVGRIEIVPEKNMLMAERRCVRVAVVYDRKELELIYDAAVSELESAYRQLSDLEDVDVAKEPPEMFDIEDEELIKSLQSIVLKTDAAMYERRAGEIITGQTERGAS